MLIKELQKNSKNYKINLDILKKRIIQNLEKFGLCMKKMLKNVYQIYYKQTEPSISNN